MFVELNPKDGREFVECLELDDGFGWIKNPDCSERMTPTAFAIYCRFIEHGIDNPIMTSNIIEWVKESAPNIPHDEIVVALNDLWVIGCLNRHIVDTYWAYSIADH